jgi:hypothetical protein
MDVDLLLRFVARLNEAGVRYAVVSASGAYPGLDTDSGAMELLLLRGKLNLDRFHAIAQEFTSERSKVLRDFFKFRDPVNGFAVDVRIVAVIPTKLVTINGLCVPIGKRRSANAA